MLVAMTLHNSTTDTQFGDLPSLREGLVSGPAASTLEFRGPQAFTARLTTLAPSDVGEAGDTFRLRPGEQRRFLVDMMLSVHDLPSGPFELRVTVEEDERSSPPSGTARFELVEPSDLDRTVRETWFHQVDGAPCLSWDDFLTRWFTPAPAQELSGTAGRAVAYARFVHYAAYGPKPIAAQDATELLALEGHVALAEFHLFQHEILVARGAQAAASKLKGKILDRWPGLAYEVDKNERGKGLLSSMRKRFGAGGARAQEPNSVPPYTGASIP